MGALVTAGLGLASAIVGATASGISSRRARKSVQDTNKANLELAKYQNDWNLQQWNRENEYNSPVEQMNRLEEAGLNPNLVYGNGATTQAATSPRAADMKVEPYTGQVKAAGDSVNHIFAGLRLGEELDLIRNQNKNAETQREVMKSEIISKSIEQAGGILRNAKSEFDLDMAREMRDTSIQLQEQQLRNLITSNESMKGDVAIKESQLDTMELNRQYTRAQIKQIFQAIENAKMDFIIKGEEATARRYDNKLRALGINPNDGILERILGRVLTEPDYFDNLKRNFMRIFGIDDSTDFKGFSNTGLSWKDFFKYRAKGFDGFGIRKPPIVSGGKYK